MGPSMKVKTRLDAYLLAVLILLVAIGGFLSATLAVVLIIGSGWGWPIFVVGIVAVIVAAVAETILALTTGGTYES